MTKYFLFVLFLFNILKCGLLTSMADELCENPPPPPPPHAHSLLNQNFGQILNEIHLPEPFIECDSSQGKLTILKHFTPFDSPHYHISIQGQAYDNFMSTLGHPRDGLEIFESGAPVAIYTTLPAYIKIIDHSDGRPPELFITNNFYFDTDSQQYKEGLIGSTVTLENNETTARVKIRIQQRATDAQSIYYDLNEEPYQFTNCHHL